MSSTARMDRARLERFNRFWEELLQAVPDARRQAVEEAGAAVQRELNAQIGAAELADGAKGTVRTWQELRWQQGGYAALSPGKGTAQPRAGEAQHTWKGKPVSKKQVTRWLERGHGTRRPAAPEAAGRGTRRGGPESRGPQPPDMSRAGNSIAGQRRRRWSSR